MKNIIKTDQTFIRQQGRRSSFATLKVSENWRDGKKADYRLEVRCYDADRVNLPALDAKRVQGLALTFLKVTYGTDIQHPEFVVFANFEGTRKSHTAEWLARKILGPACLAPKGWSGFKAPEGYAKKTRNIR